ncbi:hypothetical protein DPMN_076036 [Dreissena polymorpha]|uniref:Uncharacterized protein n=1 Tax=Dreissena polymorpha TaxID=45954 RepID=A0A9D3YMX3_DREPO|nr:hypothetical protein DPMN_076036 [Dreissena polymorpha]
MEESQDSVFYSTFESSLSSIASGSGRLFLVVLSDGISLKYWSNSEGIIHQSKVIAGLCYCNWKFGIIQGL